MRVLSQRGQRPSAASSPWNDHKRSEIWGGAPAQTLTDTDLWRHKHQRLCTSTAVSVRMEYWRGKNLALFIVCLFPPSPPPQPSEYSRAWSHTSACGYHLCTPPRLAQSPVPSGQWASPRRAAVGRAAAPRPRPAGDWSAPRSRSTTAGTGRRTSPPAARDWPAAWWRAARTDSAPPAYRAAWHTERRRGGSRRGTGSSRGRNYRTSQVNRADSHMYVNHPK